MVKKKKKSSGGPSIPQKGKIHGGPMLHITLKSIYMTKKLTPGVILPLLGANRVKRLHNVSIHSLK